VKAYVEAWGNNYRTVVQHDNQYFTIAPDRVNREEAEWMAKMFNIALRRHDRARDRRRKRIGR